MHKSSRVLYEEQVPEQGPKSEEFRLEVTGTDDLVGN